MFDHIRKFTPILVVFTLLLGSSCYAAQKKHGPEKRPGGPPPAKVMVSTLRAGNISPMSEFTGTIYYKEVSNLAAETTGKVKTLYLDDGMMVKKGDVLITLNSAMLRKEIAAKKAARAEVASEIKKAKSDLGRATDLYKKKLLAAKDFDKYRFDLEGLKSRSLSLKAEIERLAIELAYKSVRAPFDGIIMRKKVERGDWVNPGTVVATVGNNSEMYLVVNVPQKAVPYIRKGFSVKVGSGVSEYRARVHAIIPQGDIRTRTFPVKLRIIDKQHLLYEGMEGSASLPVGREIKSLLINRDAVTSVMGQNAVYGVIGGKAVMIPVSVTGFKGVLAGISGQGLKAGMSIVVKGNERLRPGQPVIIINKGK